MAASDGGKGSAPRPIPDPQKFRDNWDQIFGKKPKEEQKWLNQNSMQN